jgi:hydrogenase-4 component E
VSPAVLWLLIGLGFAVVVVRRRTVAIALVAAQSLALGVAALVDALGSSGLTVAAAVLLARALVLPAILMFLVSRTREVRRPASEGPALLRLAAAAAVVLAAVALVPAFGLDSRAAEQASVGLLLLGIVIGATRRPVVFQALAFLIAENGVYIATLALAGGVPAFIEIGVLFDLVVIVSVAGAFGARIHEEFGTGDTSVLRGLRD